MTRATSLEPEQPYSPSAYRPDDAEAGGAPLMTPFFVRNVSMADHARSTWSRSKFPCLPPGMVTSSAETPALFNASTSRTSCSYGTTGSASPWIAMVGGRPARTYVIGEIRAATSLRFGWPPIQVMAYTRV